MPCSKGTKKLQTSSLELGSVASMPCKIPKLALTRAGKPYLKAILRDATGEASLRCWDVGEDPRKAEPALSRISETGFVQISGATENFNDALQIKCQVDQMESSTLVLRS